MDYKDLKVWKKSITLVKDIYNLCKKLPDDERYGLIDQIKRSAVSIAANIAEGSGRNTTREFIQFLYISLGSACELETHLIISKEIGYLSDIENLIERINDIRRMINGLINSLRKGSKR